MSNYNLIKYWGGLLVLAFLPTRIFLNLIPLKQKVGVKLLQNHELVINL